jgi:hypothetical protein
MYHKQHYSVILKTGRKAEMKQSKQKWAGSKFSLVKHKMIWLSTVLCWKETFFGLTIADAMRLGYQLTVRNGIKNQFCKRNEKAGKKRLKNFLSSSRNFS